MWWLLSSLALASEQGEVVGVVFLPDGRPVAGALIRAGELTARTDAGGAWRLSLDAGEATVSVEAPGQAPVSEVVPVVAGRTTELLVTVGPGGAVSLEAPPESTAGPEVPSGPPGRLTGVVTDADSGRPLAQARIFVRGSAVEAVTDEEGRFALELPGGAWDLSAVRAGYGTEALAVEVVSHDVRELGVALTKSGLVLDAMVVKAPKITGGTASLLDERQEASTVSDVLGAEQMSRAGDSDAASALRRVTGLTVVGGKYVYVRGLGDRYSATLLDRSPLPSPEPEKRVVPLDLFPASLLDSVVVQKTFSPDRPAEFGGGVVEVRTRSIPEDPLFSIALSGTYTAGTTFVPGQFGDTGPTDVLGIDGGYRDLPGEVAAASEESAIKPGGIFSEDGYTANELERFGELIPNRWGLDPRTLPPDLGVTITAGGSVPAGNARLGGLVGLVFSNGWDLEDGFQTLYSQGAAGLEEKRRTTFVEVTNQIRLGGALALGASWDGGEVSSKTLLLRNSAGSALTYFADDPTGSNDTDNARVAWLEQQLLFEQVSLTQSFGDKSGVTARYAAAMASGNEPDRRDWTYLATDQGRVLSQRASWSEMMSTSLDDVTHDVAADLDVGPFKGGGELTLRHRTSTTRRFGYEFQGSEGIDLSAPIDEVIVPENIGAEGPDDPGYLELEENTTNSDDYTARQELLAGYLMADAPWTERFSTLVGARVEHSSQEVETFELFATTADPVTADLTTTDVLPAATFTVGVGPEDDPQRLLVRGGYGRTLSRPEFRELSEVAFYDYRSGRLLFGNPDLKRATIDNVDARLEWYPSDGESVSAGAFYKRFTDPIESVVAVSAVSGSVGTFANATSATNLGLEVDLRKNLLADLWLSANGSLVRSTVDLSGAAGNQTSTERPLQGQSPWVANVQLSWEDPDERRQIAVLYNAFGPRIVEVGTQGIPDTYELPVHRVDLVATEGLGDRWSLRLRGTNLLDQRTRERTGDEVSQEVREGWGAGAQITWAP